MEPVPHEEHIRIVDALGAKFLHHDLTREVLELLPTEFQDVRLRFHRGQGMVSSSTKGTVWVHELLKRHAFSRDHATYYVQCGVGGSEQEVRCMTFPEARKSHASIILNVGPSRRRESYKVFCCDVDSGGRFVWWCMPGVAKVLGLQASWGICRSNSWDVWCHCAD